MGQDCLDRRTLSALAAGQCPAKDLRAVQRHLPTCARCRAAVVASAAGVRGPGETVVLKRSGVRGGGRGRTVLKVASVAVSLLVVGGAWRYGQSSTLPPSSPPAAAPFAAPASASEPPVVARPSDATLPETLEVVAPLQPAALQPAALVPQVEVRPVYEPVADAPARVEPPAEPAAEVPASAPAQRSRRPPIKKHQRPASQPGRADLPDSNEGEGTDRFGLEW
jgi:hypothetical protein